ncbi:MAG: pyrroline-5-carboxylate reductase [Candidatus Omnitrophota bacterium]
MRDISIGIIGCGNMGSAIAGGIVKKQIIELDRVFLYDKEIKKAEILSQKIKAKVVELSDLVKSSDFLLIAVKPQDFSSLLEELVQYIDKQTIISVMAGISMLAINDKIKKETAIARVMPNMAAFVGESITCLSFNDKVKNRQEIKDIFTGIGQVLEVDETLLDSVTALAGSGPAYLFYFAKALIEAGVAIGLDVKTAQELTIQTLYGASLLLKETKFAPEDLIEKVASKGGTTEAGLKVFEAERMKDIIKTAVKQAKKRAEELCLR